MSFHTARPEDRRRLAPETPLWLDAAPDCYRSEAFAEDLPFVESVAIVRAQTAPSLINRWRHAAAALGLPLGTAAAPL